MIKVFVEMYNKGLIYRGKRLVNWDPHFETAISDLEVENIEVDGHMWHFKYPLAGGETYEYVEKDEDGNVTLRETRDYISIATTRPETMLGDGAVAVHPSDERYAPIVGKLCEIPVGPKEHRRLIPIITDEYPDPTFGSGAVKITGAHDFNDYGVANAQQHPDVRADGHQGRTCAPTACPMTEAAAQAIAIAEGARGPPPTPTPINLVPDDYRGLDRFEARKLVIDAITAEGLAVMDKVPDTDAILTAPEANDGLRSSSRNKMPRGRSQENHAALRRPLQGRHRADADRPVVRRHRQDRAARHRRGALRARSRSCPNRTRRSISTGWKISSPGASRASSGGGIRFRSGMGLTVRSTIEARWRYRHETIRLLCAD